MSNKKFYLTTTLPYVNSDPHVGFAMEIVRADTLARFKRLSGYEIFFNTGTDEHGAKIHENALKAELSTQVYVDGYADKFKKLNNLLNIEDVHFIRTTDKKHVLAAQEMWKRCFDNGFIYKKNYKSKYCVGCELNKTDSELVDGKCAIHPNRDIELIDEENYFFKFSEFQKPLLDFYKENPTFVVPDFRFNEIKAFVERGLEDFSISRLKTKMPWGVEVPGDSEHVMYVWFDALTSYISTLNWPEAGDFEVFWMQEGGEKREVVQYCGKDNLRQQSAMWQAMLMAANLPNSTQIIINGFIMSGGQKMSKSIGNVINPFDVVEAFKNVTDYPEDVLRFVLLHDISSFEDGDITMESIKESYRTNLQNGIGNLVNRVLKMAITNNVKINRDIKGRQDYHIDLSSFDLKDAIARLNQNSRDLDKYIDDDKPFKVIKENKLEGERLIEDMLFMLENFTAKPLSIFLPRTSAKIIECIREHKMPEKPLFNRLEI
jgi:methionyl-tRNA synthetase